MPSLVRPPLHKKEGSSIVYLSEWNAISGRDVVFQFIIKFIVSHFVAHIIQEPLRFKEQVYFLPSLYVVKHRIRFVLTSCTVVRQ